MGRLRRLLVVVSLVLAVGFAGGCGGSSSRAGGEPATVQVAAASDLRFALDEIRDELAQHDPPIEVVPVYGSSGQFLQQIRNGAPFDVYLSADLAYPAELVDEGMAQAADLFQYAVGRLVLWVPNDSSLDLTRGLEVLADPAVSRVAIANPEHAPYGVAAVAAMRSAGVYDEVRSKLVMGENAAQAGEFVISGNADVGIVALALALGDSMAARGRFEEIPLAAFPRMDQGGVVLAGAQNRTAALALRDFMLNPEGAAILQRYGFLLPDDA